MLLQRFSSCYDSGLVRANTKSNSHAAPPAYATNDQFAFAELKKKTVRFVTGRTEITEGNFAREISKQFRVNLQRLKGN